ncbi:MAG: carbamoyl-phosphate synthase large subunit [Coriobacteriales bacterium]|jgi:carbamoyl-phosphate synthase large subunit|nr:carbamoyl-phosphate synthase large subunit [Coriobacteriales bacterium]
MPKRTDIQKILLIGSGPIVIGQACEFDYSGTQACKVLAEEGYQVVLVNSNPATIMTDPQMATRTYVEPLTPGSLTRIIEIERPDALLATMGGQTALNSAVELANSGVLDRYQVELIGCDLHAIQTGEDRRLFAEAMAEIGLECARSGTAYSVADAEVLAQTIGYPVVLRPAYTLGGAGSGIAHNLAELQEIVSQGLALSRAAEVLVEESVIGWKEIEIESMRDRKGNSIIICSIENVDAMGIHTGDSITVAPAMTLTKLEYQRIVAASRAIMEKVGVAGSGANIQFAINPQDGRMLVIEMNPRVSRSSALASKATGFPIAKMATKLAVGYTLDEIQNDVTGVTSACFEPSIDYVVVKYPRFAFEKFKGTETILGTRMKAVGEVMAIGRTFEEALGKAIRSLETGRAGLGADGKDEFDEEHFWGLVSLPTEQQLFYIAEALRRGFSVQDVYLASKIDPWFLERIKAIVQVQESLSGKLLLELGAADLWQAKRFGLSDTQIAYLTESSEADVRAYRKGLEVLPTFKRVDTCAGEYASLTSYFYKTYEPGENEVHPATKPRAVILGAGPNRIGQGIEFDYCCVHAAYALADIGYETVMINCNPETVSTDYDTSDRLYFEPLTFEDVLDVVEVEDPAGVLVTLGGQTPLKLAQPLLAAGVPIMGTQPESIDLAEDRERFAALLDSMQIAYPPAGTAVSHQEALDVAARLGFPLLVRPSYVLGGRGMVIAYNQAYLDEFIVEAVRITPDHPVYLDHFLESAIEVDVDALCDHQQVYIGGILEHIEEAGIHSGDSSCCLPPFSLSDAIIEDISNITRRLALAVGVSGLVNIQFAVKDTQVYVIEVNPRASRTVPFTSKASGVPLAKCAAKIMAGQTIASLGLPEKTRVPKNFNVKEAVMPFGRFPGADIILGPEMKSTGEVMGIGPNYPTAYAKAALSIDYSLPKEGVVFVSVCDKDKRAVISIANNLVHLGFSIISTEGTAKTLKAAGIPVTPVRKIQEESPNIADEIAAGRVQMMINTPLGQETRGDGFRLRTHAVRYGLCYATTLAGANAMIGAIAVVQRDAGLNTNELAPIALQDLGQWNGLSDELLVDEDTVTGATADAADTAAAEDTVTGATVEAADSATAEDTVTGATVEAEATATAEVTVTGATVEAEATATSEVEVTAVPEVEATDEAETSAAPEADATAELRSVTPQQTSLFDTAQSAEQNL